MILRDSCGGWMSESIANASTAAACFADSKSVTFQELASQVPSVRIVFVHENVPERTLLEGQFVRRRCSHYIGMLRLLINMVTCTKT